MELFIHTFDNKIHSCKFSNTDTIRTVQQRFNPSLETLILYRNSILVPNLTLFDYKITSGDHIYIIPQTSSVQQKSLVLESNLPAGPKFEIERMKDQMYFKLDSSPQYYIKIVKRFNRMVEREFTRQDTQTPIIPSIPNKPSVAPLPAFWK
ncbi:hypothetical protein TVAG_190370 [Trichomonas vaginalis G3]|uniref:Ubiquitin-like domain-containing protein n=1 Tax=Trichomonas vaginalis (strain ATCC PRA-98 / G3) TaxID=412133 RepID=A2DKG5_TRIV3|nr:ubiquitin-like family [Trichomonas vaginalis G3]EAY19142.1 hypothetical protein TVAG_190370 [Trichomonas vaginalis G3]KAI5490440.1 ubiquitin-like family [Trichomonas vaginalis G3]|eukprot:XP_001580128.1 hypothetical protein [Trichomonas vaginalis G3]